MNHPNTQRSGSRDDRELMRAVGAPDVRSALDYRNTVLHRWCNRVRALTAGAGAPVDWLAVRSDTWGVIAHTTKGHLIKIGLVLTDWTIDQLHTPERIAEAVRTATRKG